MGQSISEDSAARMSQEIFGLSSQPRAYRNPELRGCLRRKWPDHHGAGHSRGQRCDDVSGESALASSDVVCFFSSRRLPEIWTLSPGPVFRPGLFFDGPVGPPKAPGGEARTDNSSSPPSETSRMPQQAPKGPQQAPKRLPRGPQDAERKLHEDSRKSLET